jgi:hypothetical protein
MTSHAPVRTVSGVLAGLLIVCAALLIFGVTLEHRTEAARSTPASSEASASSEGSGHDEGPHHDEGGAEAAAGSTGETGETDESETVLGVRIESPGAVAAFAVISVALAAVVWRRPGRATAVVVAVVAAGATVLDVAEIGHQLSQNRNGLAALAAVIALGHLVIVGVAGVLWRQTVPPQPTPAALG